jgi:C4-dicarboxylate transporter, DctM subunit
MMIIIGLLLVVLALAGVPLFSVVAAVGLLAFNAADIDTAAMIGELFRLGDFPALIAIPFFTFAGYTLAESSAPKRIIAFVEALLGWMPSGLAVVALVATAIFTAFTGASGVTIIALGALLYPELINAGYPERFSLGLVTTSGSLGLLFPPSLPIILYSIVAGVSIDALFLGGLVPGLLLMVVLAGYSVHVGRTAKVKRTPFDRGAVLKAVKEAAWELPLPFVVIGGIYGGMFAASEAATIAAAYVLVVEVFIRKELSITRDVPRVIRESMMLVGAILVMLGCAAGLTNYLVDQEVPKAIFSLMNEYVSNKYMFLIILNILLLVVNMLEVFSAIIMIVPIIIPIAIGYGINPVHLGIMFLLNLEIGYMVPPLALNIFLSSLRFKKSLPDVYRAVAPFLVLLVLLLLLVTYVPELSLLFARTATSK